MAKAAAATKTVTVTAKQIAGTLAEKHELQKKLTLAVFEDFFAAITKSLKKGERVRMGDIGILQVRKRAARIGRNPQTGEPIKIKASKKVAFRASKVLKEAI
jgi:DNA-binding protein HU-beta